jgi:pyrroline-5-carboxylate reductase
MNNNNLSISFIGPGMMAEAMVSGLLKNRVTTSQQITMLGPNKDRNIFFEKEYGVKTTENNQDCLMGSDLIILSIKPQRLKKVMAELKGKIPKDATILSIVAGSSIELISHGLDHHAVIRAMPNTPSKIGEGITVWTASSAVNDSHREIAAKILNSMGEEIFMEEESFLDKATALSGTGPAYVFLFMEAMIDAGVHLGFPRKISEKLVAQTLKGSALFYDSCGDIHIATLRNNVTSPSGTTASALYELEKAGFRTAIANAIWAAFDRSKELGSNPKTHSPD